MENNEKVFSKFKPFSEAEEVVRSAGRVLASMGLSQAHISQLFQQASETVEPASNDRDGVGSRDSDGAGVCDGDHDAVMERIGPRLEAKNFKTGHDAERLTFVWNFNRHPAIKKLNVLTKRLRALTATNPSDNQQRILVLLEEAIALRVAALQWAKVEAVQRGIELHAVYSTWVSNASDQDLDREDEIFFLSDHDFDGDMDWNDLLDLARRMLIAGDKQGFDRLYDALAGRDICFEPEKLNYLTHVWHGLQHFDAFGPYIMNYAGAGEVTQSTTFDAFLREVGVAIATEAMEAWVDKLASEGLVTRYKRNGRWRLVVA